MITLGAINNLTGHKFELFTSHLLHLLNYKNIHVVNPNDNHGFNVLASTRSGKSIGIQCKHVFKKRKVDSSTVEQAVSGKKYYKTNVSVLLTNGYFTRSAIRNAKKSHIVYWDAHNLRTLIDIANNFHTDAVTLPDIHPAHRFKKTDKIILNYLLNLLRNHKTFRECHQITLQQSSLIHLGHLLYANGIKRDINMTILHTLYFIQQHFMVRYQQYNGKKTYSLAFDAISSEQHVFVELHCTPNLIKALKYYSSNKTLIKHGSYVLGDDQVKRIICRNGSLRLG